MAKVSIIIPTYNVEMYLVECMESVVNQTLKDIEIICINDGSTDGSLEILKSYAQKDDRIVLVDKENGGYGIGMNIGLDKATGEYIGIVEPDDFIPLNMYSDLYEKAVKTCRGGCLLRDALRLAVARRICRGGRDLRF